MLNRLSDHIVACLENAAEARQKADETADARMRDDWLVVERAWANLARSYELSEALERFLPRVPTAQAGWRPISSAPLNYAVELAVIEHDQVHALAFPCRRAAHGGWTKLENDESVIVFPSHWRSWEK
jgi:hypothetical protein